MNQIKSSKLIQFILAVIFMISNTFAQNTIDFGQLKNLEQVKSYFNNPDNKSDFAYGDYKTYEKGFWNKIPVENIVLYENSLQFAIKKESKGSTIKVTDYLKKTFPNDIIISDSYSYKNYSINLIDQKIEFTVDVDENGNLKENTTSTMRIIFKEVSTNPLAKISSEIKNNLMGRNYFLNLDYFQVSPKIYLNGLPLYSKIGQYRFINEDNIYLNQFILNSKTPIHLKFIIDPGVDENGNPRENIIKESFITISLEKATANDKKIDEQIAFNNKEYVTDTIKEGDIRYSSYTGTYKYGMKNIEAEYTFIPQVDYEVKGWSNGKDLRKEKDLEQKILKFYQDFGQIILEKDINKLSKLLYDSTLENYTYNYNISKTKSFDFYNELENIINSTFKTTVAQETKLHISTDGKLAYLEALDKTSCLKAIGKNFSKDFSFYFYIDQNTNDLKIIR